MSTNVPVGSHADAVDPASLPDSAVICLCGNVTRGALGAAIAEGAATVEELGARAHAAQGCGSCRPLLKKLLDAPKRENDAPPPLKGPFFLGLFLLSLATALLPVLYLLPGFPPPQSVEATGLLQVFLFQDFWRQVSGYAALGLFALSLVLPINKRLRRLTFLPYTAWLIIHAVFIFLASVSLLVHTNLTLGERIGFQTMFLFLGLMITGTLLTGALFLEQGAFGPFVRRRRPVFLRLHNTLVAAFLVHVAFHVTAIYYF